MKRCLLAILLTAAPALAKDGAKPAVRAHPALPTYVAVAGYRASDHVTGKAVGAALVAAHVEYDLLISYGATVDVRSEDAAAAKAVIEKLIADHVDVHLVAPPPARRKK